MIAIIVVVALFFMWFTEMFVTALPWDAILRFLRRLSNALQLADLSNRS